MMVRAPFNQSKTDMITDRRRMREEALTKVVGMVPGQEEVVVSIPWVRIAITRLWHRTAQELMPIMVAKSKEAMEIATQGVDMAEGHQGPEKANNETW